MSATQKPALYDELVDLLAETADADRVLSFHLSPGKQGSLNILLEKNRQGTLTQDEAAELDAFEHFEHLVRLLKARLLQNRAH